MPNMDLVGFSDCYVLAKWIPGEASADSKFSMDLFTFIYVVQAQNYVCVCRVRELSFG